MVLVFSAHSNTSGQVLREVQLAVDAQLHILQFRIEDVLPNDDLKYYLSTPHWMDAMTPPLERHLERLAGSLRTLLGKIDGNENVPAAQQSKPTPIVSPAKTSPSRQTNLWLSIAIGLLVLVAIVAGLMVLQHREQLNSEARPSKTTPASSVAHAETPAPGPNAIEANVAAKPTPSAKGAPIFRDQFQTASAGPRPLFDTNAMTVTNSNHVCQVTAKSAGIVPAIFEDVLADNFILECGVRADSVPAGASFGFIFRASDIENGGIAKYYALLFDLHQHVVRLSWWDSRWMINPEDTLPAGLFRIGQRSRITLEAAGNRFRVFINGQFVAEFNNEGLNEGRVGFCLSSTGATPWTVQFDDLEIFSLPGTK